MKTLKRNPWYIAAGCFLQMFLGMGLCSSFSMMLPEISAHTGISTGSISGNLTVAYLASFIVSMFFFKPLLRKFGAKKLLIFGDLLLMFHYILYSYAETLWFLRICGTLGGLVTLFACATPVSVVITNWFVDKRSSVLAFIMGGYGFGGMIILPIVGRLIAAYGYQVAYRCHALGGVLLLLVTIFMIVDDPAKLGVKPYGYEKAAEIAAAVAAKKEKESRQGGLIWPRRAGRPATGCCGSALRSPRSPAWRSGFTTARSSAAPSVWTPSRIPTGRPCCRSASRPA